MTEILEKIKAYIKGAFKSKTIWFSGAIGALGALNDNSQYIHALMSDVNFNQFMIGVAVITALLRIMTNSSLADK